MKEKYPKVTVVTVSFNAVNDIEKTILSVLNQTYSNLEYIIIDGGSTDGTVDIIKKYAARLSYWVSEPDGGIYYGMNKGIQAASGEWINFMNAGDTFYDKNVIKDVFINDYSPNIKVIYGNVFKKDADSSLSILESKSISYINRYIPFCHQAEFLKNYDKKEISFRAAKYELCADYDVAFRIYRKYGATAFLKIDTVISIFDFTGISNKKGVQVFKENLEIRSSHKDIYWYWDKAKDLVKSIIFKKYPKQ